MRLLISFVLWRPTLFCFLKTKISKSKLTYNKGMYTKLSFRHNQSKIMTNIYNWNAFNKITVDTGLFFDLILIYWYLLLICVSMSSFYIELITYRWKSLSCNYYILICIRFPFLIVNFFIYLHVPKTRGYYIRHFKTIIVTMLTNPQFSLEA